jgi:Cu(I)-responsive transcriptional regulator
VNIGHAAKTTGVPAKTIRHYEEVGLVTPDRDPNGYRVFTENHLHKLRFLGRARGLGFSIEDCRVLLALYDDTDRASSDVKRVARKHLDEIEAKILDLRAMHGTLTHLIEACAGDDRPDCPILDGLGGQREFADISLKHK